MKIENTFFVNNKVFYNSTMKNSGRGGAIYLL